MDIKSFLVIDENYTATASALIRNATNKVYITAFKMQPVKPGKNLKLTALYRALELAAQKKVDVKILLNQIWGKSTISKMNTLTAEFLKKKSIEVRTLPGNRTVHAKMIIIDGTQILIGSHNWSGRSLNYNFELSVFMKDGFIPSVAQSVFMDLWNKAKIF